MSRSVVGLVALVVGGLVHAAAVPWFLIDTCAVSDVAHRGPAPASAQGLLCDYEDHWLNATPYVALALSLVLSVVLAVVLWSKAGAARWVGLAAVLWLPVVVSLALALPGDSCSSLQRRDLPAADCDRSGNG